MQELDLLQNKLQLLLKKHQALKLENQRLKKTIVNQGEDIKSLNKKMEDIEQDRMLDQLGKKVLSNDEKKTMKKQISNVISEIDKLLHSLND